MSIRRVDCGDVFYPAPVDGVVVGTNPVWGDGSVFTYADTDSTLGTSSHVDWPAAYVINPSGSFAVETLTIHLRAALFPDWDDPRVGIYAGTTVGLGSNDLTPLIDEFGTTQITLSDATVDYAVVSTTPSTFVNVLAGAWFVTVVPQSVNVAARIYELWFEVGTTTTNPPMRRKYPNATGLGVGPIRHWPRPRRGVGGIN